MTVGNAGQQRYVAHAFQVIRENKLQRINCLVAVEFRSCWEFFSLCSLRQGALAFASGVADVFPASNRWFSTLFTVDFTEVLSYELMVSPERVLRPSSTFLSDFLVALTLTLDFLIGSVIFSLAFPLKFLCWLYFYCFLLSGATEPILSGSGSSIIKIKNRTLKF